MRTLTFSRIYSTISQKRLKLGTTAICQKWKPLLSRGLLISDYRVSWTMKLHEFCMFPQALYIIPRITVPFQTTLRWIPFLSPAQNGCQKIRQAMIRREETDIKIILKSLSIRKSLPKNWRTYIPLWQHTRNKFSKLNWTPCSYFRCLWSVHIKLAGH